jgi:hypothetical protein
LPPFCKAAGREIELVSAWRLMLQNGLMHKLDKMIHNDRLLDRSEAKLLTVVETLTCYGLACGHALLYFSGYKKTIQILNYKIIG